MAIEIDAIQNSKSIGWADALLARLAAGSISTPKLTILGGTITTDLPVVNSSVTWNNVAVTFTGIKLNVTDTNSASGSLFLDFQRDSTTKFSVDKLGIVTLAVAKYGGENFQSQFAGDFYTESDGAYIWRGRGTSIEQMRLAANGKLGIRINNPTAAIHLPSSTTAAGTAPAKIAAGVLMTTPEAGAIEYDGTNLYFTDGGGTRRTLAVV